MRQNQGGMCKGLAVVGLVLLLGGSPVFGVNLVVNGGFETGNLSGWTVFATAGGTTGEGLPDVVMFDTNHDWINSLAARFCVGQWTAWLQQGGGIYQNVRMPAGTYTMSADIAMLDDRNQDNASGGLFQLMFDGVVVDSHDFGSAVLGVPEFAQLSYSGAVSAGTHELRIKMTRGGQSNINTTPFQYIDNVMIVPEPGGIGVLAMGLVALLKCKRGL